MTTRDRHDCEGTADLVARAADGESAAWDELVRLYGGVIWAVTRSFRLREADASDVVQTTWLRLLEHLDRLTDPGRVGAWLATTARRECLRTLALAKRTSLAGEDEQLLERVDGSIPDVDSGLIAAEQAAQVHEALAHLPHRWRELLVMLTADPAPSYQDISDRLQVPIGSIGPTRGRALRRLHELLDPDVLIPVTSFSG